MRPDFLKIPKVMELIENHVNKHVRAIQFLLNSKFQALRHWHSVHPSSVFPQHGCSKGFGRSCQGSFPVNFTVILVTVSQEPHPQQCNSKLSQHVTTNSFFQSPMGH